LNTLIWASARSASAWASAAADARWRSASSSCRKLSARNRNGSREAGGVGAGGHRPAQGFLAAGGTAGAGF